MATITDTYADQSPEKIALQTLHEKITYKTWNEKVCQTANWLDSLNLANHTLGFLLPNGIPFLQLFTGASLAGWTSVPFDPKWTEAELLQRLSLSRPSVFITTQELYPNVKHLHHHVLLWEDCFRKINLFSTARTQPADGKLPFYMGFTSGTTGVPKAFIRSHDSWVASFDCNRVDFHLDESDQVLIPGALIHSHFLYGAISTLYLGGTVYLLEKFSATQTLSIIEVQPITAIYVVPTMLAALLKLERTIEKPLKILSSGAKWEEHSKELMKIMFPNMSMYDFYGASELSFVTVLTEHQKSGSVGKPCHNVEIQIRKENSELALPNETGKIFVRSKLTFIGYLNEGTLQTIHDENGWITVHDMGYLDEDGFLFIQGREKNMILYGAINIFPEEIEKVLSEHPGVEEVAVIGVPDPYWGQIVAAVVKGNARKKELKRRCRQTLSSFKVPRKWVFVDEMPHTTSGKIARPQVRELIESKVNSH